MTDAAVGGECVSNGPGEVIERRLAMLKSSGGPTGRTGDLDMLPDLALGEDRMDGDAGSLLGEVGSVVWIGDGGLRGIDVIGIIAGEKDGVTKGDTGAVGKCGRVTSLAYGCR